MTRETPRPDLRDYAQHTADCGARLNGVVKHPRPCTCGLDALLADHASYRGYCYCSNCGENMPDRETCACRAQAE
jgi:hypothetical protein